MATLTATLGAVMDQDVAGDAIVVASNAAPVAIAPTIVSTAQMKVKLAKTGPTALNLTCAPAVQPGQTVALVLNAQVVTLAPVQAATTKLGFSLTVFTAGTYTMRLRIDAVDSIPVAAPVTSPNPFAPAPMQFDPTQQVVLCMTSAPDTVTADLEGWEAVDFGLPCTRRAGLAPAPARRRARPAGRAALVAGPSRGVRSRRRSSSWATGWGSRRSSGSCCSWPRPPSSTPAWPRAAPRRADNTLAAYPTLALALACLPDATWDVVSRNVRCATGG